MKTENLTHGSYKAVREVSMEALRKICTVLDCNIADIVEFEKRDN